MEFLIISQEEVRQLLDLDRLLEDLSKAFLALSMESVVSPPRSQVTTPDGYMLAMPAWMPQSPVSIKLVTVFHKNRLLGLPGHQGLIALFDPESGTPLAIMDGIAITALRTAAGSALSSLHLSRHDPQVLAIIGAGVQGHSHLTMLTRVHQFKEIRMASYDPQDARDLACRHPGARACASFAEAVKGADVVCLCTSSPDPVIEVEWLSPGCHVTSVGYAPPGGELPRGIIQTGKVVVETRLAFEPPPIGCAELGGLDSRAGIELGEIISGKKRGRENGEEITVYKAMGHAVEDLVAANIVYENAKAKGVGQRVHI